jgi:hypothetical protein
VRCRPGLKSQLVGHLPRQPRCPVRRVADDPGRLCGRRRPDSSAGGDDRRSRPTVSIGPGPTGGLPHCRWHPRVRLSRLASGGGGPANFNAVTDLATGEFLKLVCGDDLLYPDCLAEQVEALAAVMAASTRDVINAAGVPVLRNRGLADRKHFLALAFHLGTTACRSGTTSVRGC